MTQSQSLFTWTFSTFITYSKTVQQTLQLYHKLMSDNYQEFMSLNPELREDESPTQGQT